MPLKFPNLVFDTPILMTEKSTQIISNGLTRVAKKYKQQTVLDMVVGPQTGRTYARRGGAGFRRYHRASSRFEHPAVDSGNLIRSVEDRKPSQLSHEVYVNDSKAPYGKWLEGPRFERAIMDEKDLQQFVAGPLQAEMDKVHEELVK